MGLVLQQCIYFYARQHVVLSAYRKGVRLSLCVSLTLCDCIKTEQSQITESLPIDLNFRNRNAFPEIQKTSPRLKVLNERVYEKFAIFNQ